MQSFVHRGTGSPKPASQRRGGTPNPADFKLPLPRTIRVKNEHHRERSGHHQQQQDGIKHENLFDSDIGSIADTTTDLNDQVDEAGGSQSLTEVHGQSMNGGNDANGNDVDDAESTDDEAIDYQALDGQKFTFSKRDNPDMFARYMAQFNEQQIEGAMTDADSYPDTTSGNISVPDTEVTAYSKPRIVPYHIAAEPAANYLPAVQRGPPMAMTVETKYAPTRNNASDISAMHQQNPYITGADHIEHEVTVTPTKASKAPTMPLEHGQRQHQTVSDTRFDQHASGNGAMDVEPLLDYDEADLYKKEFSQLQAADYDTDPRSKGRQLPQPIPPEELHDQLSALIRADAQQQKDFMCSLNLDEWEEAGDWFMDQFSGILKRFKEQRREKRKLSRGFEEQIASRHEAVAQKKESTEEALDAMKGAGVNVLNTPKKTKMKD
ncbi:hypothetical protein AAFC00_004559 [Neodothiora populina]|uniref:Extracellular mutant protein 11 C-terminal domain-containing protein n=1 Tax=Neodothiora populina TaxID=2781224 RepID=A0ABR3P2E3_9PEZI